MAHTITSVSLAGILKELARRGQYGHSRTPDDFYISPGGHSYYWSHSRDLGVTSQAMWDRLAELSARYRRFVNYCHEVMPGWKDTGNVRRWADNSVEKEQASSDRTTRWVMVDGPHGDVCF